MLILAFLFAVWAAVIPFATLLPTPWQWITLFVWYVYVGWPAWSSYIEGVWCNPPRGRREGLQMLGRYILTLAGILLWPGIVPLAFKVVAHEDLAE
jgi:hypothetical protein